MERGGRLFRHWVSPGTVDKKCQYPLIEGHTEEAMEGMGLYLAMFAG